MNASLKAKLDALRRMTTTRGCSEAEALAAAEKAAQLMREHGLTDADLEFGEEWVATRSTGRALRDDLWSCVAKVTNTASIWTAVGSGRRVVFVGREPGPQIAAYLHGVLNPAIDRVLREYRKSRSYTARRSPKSRRAAVGEFTVGMSRRLMIRLIDMFRDTMSADELLAASAELDRRFPGRVVIKGKAAAVLRPTAASEAGWRAGAAVNLAHGVGGQNDQQLALGVSR